MKTYKEVYNYMINNHGKFPDGFDQWDLKDEYGCTIAHIAAYHDYLPKDFNQWDLINDDGWTVAHSLAVYGAIPDNFNQWDIKNAKGWTVAHIAAMHKNIPKGFNQWYLKSSQGESVFETMVHYYIPDWFDDWDMVVTDDGETCREVYERITK